MRKLLHALCLIFGCAVAAVAPGCSGSVKPRLGAEYASPNGNGFIGVGLGEATWSTDTPDIGTTNVKVSLAPLWALLGLCVVGYVVYRVVRK